ncbi:pyridoxamine 5'-phosphate oxidase [Allostella sp. ATCC 35155]|nr:pyridoxamine 5'-phosphate oxidase [Stella sp. ATCC 35155]
MTDDLEPYARDARRLMRAIDRAALATVQRDAAGWPLASLVLVASDAAGRPLLLLSDLADHSRNIAADGRVSLLFDGTVGLDRPLAGQRLSLLGRAAIVEDGAARARYLARHPDAAAYAGFGDFRLYRVEPERAHLVAGFGRIRWIGADRLGPPADPVALAEAEAGIVAHMNADHCDAVQLYARVAGSREPGWRMTGVDVEGCDLRFGAAVLRVDFAEPCADAGAVRKELVRQVRAARAALTQPAAV